MDSPGREIAIPESYSQIAYKEVNMDDQEDLISNTYETGE